MGIFRWAPVKCSKVGLKRTNRTLQNQTGCPFSHLHLFFPKYMTFTPRAPLVQFASKNHAGNQRLPWLSPLLGDIFAKPTWKICPGKSWPLQTTGSYWSWPPDCAAGVVQRGTSWNSTGRDSLQNKPGILNQLSFQISYKIFQVVHSCECMSILCS